jgi:hypothetical protein
METVSYIRSLRYPHPVVMRFHMAWNLASFTLKQNVSVMVKNIYDLNKSLGFRQTQLLYWLHEMTTCFGLKEHNQANITKPVNRRCNAATIELVMWDPVWLTKYKRMSSVK